ncbi:MAG: cytoplasmic protein [Deltaproteobacteria bacterium]|nr:cytoplasmic protein [Deltaproteobacteria bacterium]
MNDSGQAQRIDFSVDKANLYREESITDLKVASIRRLIPIKSDGTDDPSRTAIFVGHTQLMSPEGPLPIQAKLPVNNLEEAMAEFPNAMQQALAEMVEKLQEMQKQQEQKKQDGSRIIVPGR